MTTLLARHFRVALQVYALLLLLGATPGLARQEDLPVRRAVEAWLNTQAPTLPGRAEFEVSPIDPANHLAPCNAFEVALAPGARLWGRTYVTVRCLRPANENGWTAYVAVRVRVFGGYVVTRRPLAQGTLLASTDLELANGDIADQPDGVLTRIDQATGRVLINPAPPGKALRAELLRQPVVVLQGQSVRVVSAGSGFRVSNEGRALNNASPGQVVQVRLDNGRVVRGVARDDGTVDVGF